MPLYNTLSPGSRRMALHCVRRWLCASAQSLQSICWTRDAATRPQSQRPQIVSAVCVCTVYSTYVKWLNINYFTLLLLLLLCFPFFFLLFYIVLSIRFLRHSGWNGWAILCLFICCTDWGGDIMLITTIFSCAEMPRKITITRMLSVVCSLTRKRAHSNT